MEADGDEVVVEDDKCQQVQDEVRRTDVCRDDDDDDDDVLQVMMFYRFTGDDVLQVYR